MLKQTKDLYQVHFTLAAAEVGLAVCNPDWSKSNAREKLLIPAIANYQQALKLSSAVGVVRDAIHDLESIRAADIKGLEPVFALLRTKLPSGSISFPTKEKEVVETLYGTGNRWALIVGVNKYDDMVNYGELDVSIKDAEALRDRLIMSGFDPKRIRLLTDLSGEAPTRNNILTTLQSMTSCTDPDDLFLFYYSGHGDEAQGDSYLVGTDGYAVNLFDTAVPISRVKAIIEKSPARAKVILLDACHAGANLPSLSKGTKLMSAEFVRHVFEEAAGIAIVASCKQGEKSFEWIEKERSVFTHFLLEALEGAADFEDKGFVSVQDVARYVTNEVRIWSSQRKRAQTPTLQYSGIGDILLARYQTDRNLTDAKADHEEKQINLSSG